MSEAGAAMRRVCVITGATRGIGRALALARAAAGDHVVALGRTQGALEELDDAIRADGRGAASLVPVDVTDGDALDRLGAALHERFGRVDGLAHVAGVLGPITPVNDYSVKEWANVMAVNLTAAQRLIRSFHPLLMQSPAPRAVFVTSGVSTKPRAFWGGYAAAKAGLDALVGCYAEEVGHTPLRVNLFNPGATATAMRAEAMPGEDPSTLPSAERVAVPLAAMLGLDETRQGARVNYRDLVSAA